MRKLIFFPGDISSSFVQNELKYYKGYFDEVAIFDYGKDTQLLADICEKYGFRGYSIKNTSMVGLFEFLKWLASAEVRDEISKNRRLAICSIRRILYIFYYGYYYLKFRDLLQKEISGFNGEVYLYSYWLTKSAYTVAKFSKFNRNKLKKIISRAHRYDLYVEFNSMNYLPFRKFIECNLDNIAFISEQGCRYFNQHISAKKCCRVKARQSIERLGTFNYGNIKKKVYGNPQIVIASCSSVVPVKRLDLIIKTITELEKLGVEWIHIGDGKDMKRMKKLAKEKLPFKSYKFIGVVENEKILDTYFRYNVDYFINLSDSEGVPVSVMEAMSLGIPVIARNVGGMSEIVTKETGLLLPEKWTKESIRKIVTFIEKMDVRKYRKLSKACKEKWVEMYNADKNYRKFFTKLVEWGNHG